jgi:hypothetical protein
MRTSILISALLIAFAHAAGAQIVLQKAVVANAGGRTANATTRLDYTVGETAVGIASNSTTIGRFGFWNAPTFTASVKGSGAGSIEEVAVMPNPASSMITVTVDQRTAGTLDLVLYDEGGRLVSKVFSGRKERGTSIHRYDASRLASGTYFIAAMMPGALVQSRLTIVR